MARPSPEGGVVAGGKDTNAVEPFWDEDGASAPEPDDADGDVLESPPPPQADNIVANMADISHDKALRFILRSL
jgi:hypothetical protein